MVADSYTGAGFLRWSGAVAAGLWPDQRYGKLTGSDRYFYPGDRRLVQPLRRRIQDFIDRRFYRQKYNAEQALADFAASARNETDLETLSSKLVQVISQTMQPERVSVWLRPQGRKE